MKFRTRMKKILFTILIISLIAIPATAQKKQVDNSLKREVTLYNPYKPALTDVTKKSYLPDMTDSAFVRPEFRYDIHPQPFMPSYTVSPIRPASLLPEPLNKLYNSYLNLGLGIYLTPLAELSITNERSKTGIIGFYAKHFSTNGKVELQNNKKAFAGYMDNDVSLYGKKFTDIGILNGSIDFTQKTRYAYGYDTIFKSYDPAKRNIRLNYFNAGAVIGLSSAKLDSSHLSYDFDLSYNFFSNPTSIYQHNIGLTGLMAKNYKGFYAGSGIEIDYYRYSDSAFTKPRYIAALSPFIKKTTDEWAVKLGFQALLDRGLEQSAKLHIYPDIYFGFNIVPSYLGLFIDLSGNLIKNDPFSVIKENPFFFPDSTIFKISNTNNALIARAGFKGNTGIEGIYKLSASYSIVNNMLFFSNYVETDGFIHNRRGNFFIPLTDDVEILNFHGEMSGKVTDLISFNSKANYYRYTLTNSEFAWNKPGWDAALGLKYNLRNKIIAGVELEALGKRKLLVTTKYVGLPGYTYETVDMPAYVNLNLGVEYRYSKILSFWVKVNNIGFNRYYEWAYYPTQRFIGMVGFTYSL